MTTLTTVTVKPPPVGGPEVEAARTQQLQRLATAIPADLRLPASILEDPPQDVTSIPRTCGLLSSKEIEITEDYTLVQLATAIAARKVTSVEVTTAFCRRAAIAHQLCFTLTEFSMDEALARARDLDNHLERTGQTVGPLHGVPISIKEMIPVKGQSYSGSFVVSIGTASEDSFLVSMLRDMGAVFYVKTHQPTGTFSLESTSFLGRTLNPHNIKLSSGGSSGGEGALLAMKGSIFGFGADLAGSIRLPAAYCGVYGLKGCSGFMSTAGMLPAAVPSTLNIDGIIGPMARYLDDVDYVVRHIQERRPWLVDSAMVPTPWTGISQTRTTLPSSPKIGIMETDDMRSMSPPLARALAWAKDGLARAGIEVSNFAPFQPKEHTAWFKEAVVTDGAKSWRSGLEAGKEPEYPMLEWLLKECLDSAGKDEQSATTVADIRFRRDQFRVNFSKHWLDQGAPDVIICPASWSVATMHDRGTHWCYYTQVWNTLDWPAMSMPTPIKVEKDERYSGEPLSDEDAQIRKEWQEGDYVGAPVALQIVARRYCENQLMEACGVLKAALQLP